MIFLEIMFALVAFYVITNVMIPLIWPKDFQMHWMFRGRKPKVNPDTAKAVEDLTAQSNALKQSKEQVLTQTEQQLKEAEELNQKVKSL